MEYIVGKMDGNIQAITNCIYKKTKSLGYMKIDTGIKSATFKLLQNELIESDKICLNTYQRSFLNITLGSKIMTNSVSSGLMKPIDSITFVVKNINPKFNFLIEISDEVIENEIKKDLMGLPIYKNLQLVGLKGKINLIPIDFENDEDDTFIIDSKTKIKIISPDASILIDTSDTKELFKGDFNFSEMGIGGLDKQFELIFRRAFSSRLIPEKILKNLGINHVRGLMLYGLPGCGKCLAKNTPILMYDGKIKMVQDIQIGDRLMGDDSELRNVLSLAHGIEQMYEIKQEDGYLNYVVNESHILSLKMTSMKNIKKKDNLIKASYFDTTELKYIHKYYNYTHNDEIENTLKIAREYLDSLILDDRIDIEVKDYLKLNDNLKKKIKGYIVGVEFEEKSLEINPYFLGLYLGDKILNNLDNFDNFDNFDDSKIINYLKKKFKNHNIKNINNFNLNMILNFIKNKQIPLNYKINSRINRLKLLAGLIDIYGYCKKGRYYIIEKSDILTEDIVFLSRSLGFKTTIKKVKKTFNKKNEKIKNICNLIIINGNNFENLTSLLKNKKFQNQNQNQNQNQKQNRNQNKLHNTIKINKLEVGDYYGFEIDGNRRFLLGDFTVTHNTLIARQIGKILNCEEPKIVSGPSLLSSYQGQSEKNVRDLFENALADKNSKRLHLVILDEFDAISRKRGTINDSGLSDRIVNQFLSMIDGPESLNNILLIAMTNRIELIDSALLRPGRFEVQIEINLPDDKGRLDILKIHTNKMSRSGYLKDYNLEEIANLSKNFTGAELESVIKNAVSYSIAKELDPTNLSSTKDINPIITQHELIKSVKEIRPQFGSVSKEIELITNIYHELYSNEYTQRYEDILDKINKLTKGNLLSILIQGDSYVGKTTMASQIAIQSGLNCIKFINSESLMNYPFKDALLYDIFEQAYRSDSSIIILDSIEKLIEYSKLGNVYNNKILQTIYTILSKIVESNKKIVIILTSSNKTLMANLELINLCTYSYQISDVSTNKTNDKMASEYFRDKKFNK